MFWSHEVLGPKAPLGVVWFVAHGRRLSRARLLGVNVSRCCEQILNPTVPLSLRLSGILAGGVVQIYAKQVTFLHYDSSEVARKIRDMELREQNDLPQKHHHPHAHADPLSLPALAQFRSRLQPQAPNGDHYHPDLEGETITADDLFFETPDVQSASRAALLEEEMWEFALGPQDRLTFEHPSSARALTTTTSTGTGTGNHAAPLEDVWANRHLQDLGPDQEFLATDLDPVFGQGDAIFDPMHLVDHNNPLTNGLDAGVDGIDGMHAVPPLHPDEHDHPRVVDGVPLPRRRQKRLKVTTATAQDHHLATLIPNHEYRHWCRERSDIVLNSRPRAAEVHPRKFTKLVLGEAGATRATRDLLGEWVAQAPGICFFPSLPAVVTAHPAGPTGPGTHPHPRPHLDHHQDGDLYHDHHQDYHQDNHELYQNPLYDGQGGTEPGPLPAPVRSETRSGSSVEVERLREALAAPDTRIGRRWLGLDVGGSGDREGLPGSRVDSAATASGEAEGPEEGSGDGERRPPRSRPRPRSDVALDGDLVGGIEGDLGPDFDDVALHIGRVSHRVNLDGGRGGRGSSGLRSQSQSQFQLLEETERDGTQSTPGSRSTVSQDGVGPATWAVVNFLHSHFDRDNDQDEDENVEASPLSMFQLAQGLRRGEAARFFYQLCMGHTLNLVHVSQETPYGDLLVRPGMRTPVRPAGEAR